MQGNGSCGETVGSSGLWSGLAARILYRQLPFHGRQAGRCRYICLVESSVLTALSCCRGRSCLPTVVASGRSSSSLLFRLELGRVAFVSDMLGHYLPATGISNDGDITHHASIRLLSIS
jgi:hypothetical protein